MTLRMADGPVANLPPGLDAYAGYVNRSGIGITWPGVSAIPAKYHLSITTDGAPAMCADVENGAMSSWAGYTYGYSSVSNVNGLIARYGRPKKLWTAHYTGIPHICSPACYPGLATTADGTQWTDHGGAWDESLLADDFFSLAPPPSPPPPPTHYAGDNVTSYPVSIAVQGGNGWFPSPVPAGKVFAVVALTENPDVVGRYDHVYLSFAAASEVGPHSPNGAITVSGMVADGTYGAVVWAVD